MLIDVILYGLENKDKKNVCSCSVPMHFSQNSRLFGSMNVEPQDSGG